MKTHWLVFASVALWPACVLAQTPTPPSTSPKKVALVIEPAAQAILDRATQNYQGTSGISFHLVRTLDGRNGKRDFGSVVTRYSPPNKLDIMERTRRSASSASRVVADGSNLYSVYSSEYYKHPATAQMVSSYMGSRSNSGRLISAMMEGSNPFAEVKSAYSHLSSKDFADSAVVSLGQRVVDGDVLHGIQYSYSAHFAPLPGEEPITLKEQTTAWFGGSPFLLRRVQSRATMEGNTTTVGEKIIEQQLSPTFGPDTFKWDDTGLKPASDKDDNAPYWDPRLKVGTKPFAFSTNDLQGHPISLDKYKGKVLLLDFWATWCGPCVAGLPELKSAYDKYHIKGLEVVGISSDEDKKTLASFIKARKMMWSQIFDADTGTPKLSDKYGVKAIPFLLLIGKDGKIAAVNPRGNIDKAVKDALAKN